MVTIWDSDCYYLVNKCYTRKSVGDVHKVGGQPAVGDEQFEEAGGQEAVGDLQFEEAGRQPAEID